MLYSYVRIIYIYRCIERERERDSQTDSTIAAYTCARDRARATWVLGAACVTISIIVTTIATVLISRSSLLLIILLVVVVVLLYMFGKC